MVPGKEYEDILLIENGTETKYTLYFKIKELDQDDLANELIDNIEMKVYLGGELIYEGKARGLDYGAEINLQNVIKIGDFYKNDSNVIRVTTKLADDYTNINNDTLAKIEWQFYAFYEEDTEHGYHEIIPNPKTGDSHRIVVKTLLGSLLLITIILFIIIKRQERKTI